MAAEPVAGGVPPVIVQPVFVKGTALPGDTPTSPTTEPAVQVTFVPPRTAKSPAEPMGAWGAEDPWANANEVPPRKVAVASKITERYF